jgi:hypothetical protein
VNSSILKRHYSRLDVFFKLVPRDVFNLIAEQTQSAISTAILKEEVKPTKHNSPVPFELEMVWFYATKVLLGRLKKTTIPEGITAWKSDPQLYSLPCFGKNRFAALNAFTCLDLNILVSRLRHSFRQAVVIGQSSPSTKLCLLGLDLQNQELELSHQRCIWRGSLTKMDC